MEAGIPSSVPFPELLLMSFPSLSPPCLSPVCLPHVSPPCLSLASSFLKQAMEGEYPKLLRLYNDLWRRLQQYGASLQGALGGGGALDASLDGSTGEADGQDLFTQDKQDYKSVEKRLDRGSVNPRTRPCWGLSSGFSR